jgi:hypothetical protein
VRVAPHGELEVLELDLLPPRVLRRPRRLEADALDELGEDLVEDADGFVERGADVAVAVEELGYCR